MHYFDSPIGYRSGNFCPPKNATALDILKYEVQDLGNADFETDFERSGLQYDQLGKLSANDVVWVCKTKLGALQYNRDESLKCYEVHGLEGCIIICGNIDEGFLVVQPSGMLKLGLERQKKRYVSNTTINRPTFR